MNQAREKVLMNIANINMILEEYAGSNPYLKYLCYNYVQINIQVLCNWPTPFFEQDYTKFTCEAYLRGKLTGLRPSTYDGVVYAYPDAFCPYPTSYYSVAVGNFGEPAPAGHKQLRCPFTSKLENSTEPNMFGLAQCYTMRQIPRDIFDKLVESAKMAQSIIDSGDTLPPHAPPPPGTIKTLPPLPPPSAMKKGNNSVVEDYNSGADSVVRASFALGKLVTALVIVVTAPQLLF
jgi:hypothetical protein